MAPDKGAIHRCQEIRTGTEIRHTDRVERVGSRVVLIDDILDTGATLVSACEKRVERGVRDILILVTHGLFSGDRWQAL